VLNHSYYYKLLLLFLVMDFSEQPWVREDMVDFARGLSEDGRESFYDVIGKSFRLGSFNESRVMDGDAAQAVAELKDYVKRRVEREDY